MREKFSKTLQDLKTYSAIGILGLFMGCAHELKPVSISAAADPTSEIKAQEALIEYSQKEQVNVLSPIHFAKSHDYLAEAKKDYKEGESSEDVLLTLGYSKAHLEKAEREAQKISSTLISVTTARKAAILAGADNFPKELNSLDDKLTSFTSDKKSMTPEEKVKLQSQYLNLELLAIKRSKLNALKTTLKEAKDKGALEITPIAYGKAVEQFNIAEKIIETDRHSNTKIDSAVEAAKISSLRVITLMKSEQRSRNQTPEQRAVTLESSRQATKKANATTSQVEATSRETDEMLLTQSENLIISQDENDLLKKKAQENKVVTDAAAQFDKNEADVYLQDSFLIIRLKSMNFASGRSDLPADSIAVLTKVKDILRSMKPNQVTIEGHTDGIGNADINQLLSEQRAESVLKFFTTDEKLSKNEMDSKGFGYSKPLSTNKTKEGRAQNRRVDVVINTAQGL